MNNFLKTIVLSVSTALVAVPAFAQPNQPNYQAQHANHDKKPGQTHQKNQHKNVVRPSRDWKVGQKVPKQYQAKQYYVNQKADKRLSKPNRNQQWLKVNGDYILTQGTTYSIIKIVRD